MINSGVVQPYRNIVENPGNISYMIPKSAIQSGAVKYAGLHESKGKGK